MKYYLAPLEGITNIYFRKEFTSRFNGVSKVYIPFLNPASYSMSSKEGREIDPNNNQIGIKVVPQIISKNAKETIWLINKLIELGYDEVNLNFGCPSGTVVNKNKGAGMLKDLSLLDNYLNEVFSNTNIKISIKTRLGLVDENEFIKILEIYNKYPVYELIIHPRTQKDKYVGELKLDILDYINKNTKIDLIYNGEIKSKLDIKYIETRFPFFKGIMIGRGLVSCPYLLEQFDAKLDKEKIISFYNAIKDVCLPIFHWQNTKFYLKEILALLINSFDCDKKQIKKLFKSEDESEFNKALEDIFLNCELKENLDNGINF